VAYSLTIVVESGFLISYITYDPKFYFKYIKLV
jgi:hypothetical protein